MQKTNKIFKWTLALAIVIVLNLFFNFATKLVYKAPIYDNFCKVSQVHELPQSEKSCLAVGGQWNSNYYRGYESVPVKAKIVPPLAIERELVPAGYCDEQFTCRKDFEGVNGLYNRNVFVVLVVLGLVSLFAGYLAGESAPVSLGLSLGGVVSFIVGAVRYWSDMDDYLRVIILGLALISLLWFGIKKFKGGD